MTQVAITDTTLRYAHQSLIAENLGGVGFFSLEVWGSATFDVCIRFLNEGTWRSAAYKNIVNSGLK